MSASSTRPLPRAVWITLAAALIALAGIASYLAWNDPRGRTGSTASAALPPFPAEASRWVNGEPVVARDRVLLIESWHPA